MNTIIKHSVRKNHDMIESIRSQEYDVYLHGCNCFNTMGAGIAKQLAHNFPEVREADLRTFKGDESKLGSYSKAVLPNGVIVLNVYTQFNYGRHGEHVDYSAIKIALRDISLAYRYHKIAYPKIGAGLGGGDWEGRIYPMIKEAFKNINHTLIISGDE